VLALGLIPAVVQQFVVDLRRIAFAHHVGRDRIDYRLEEVGQPPVGGDRLVQPLKPAAHAVGVEIIEQPAGVVAGVHDLRLDADGPAVGRGVDVEFGDVETERVEPADAALDAVQLGAAELLGAGQLVPELVVACIDGLDHGERIQRLVEQPASLEVAEVAEDVDPGDRQIVLALAVGQLVVQFTGLGVDQIGGELTGVAPEQDVRQ